MSIHLLLLLLYTFIGSIVSQQGFWSIYCGGSTSSKDELGISWTGDGEFVQTGESRNYGTDGRSSLRVFTSTKLMIRKNCYTIPVGKGKKILLRMTFNYGNYDGKANPPEMEIIFDGNSGGKLKTTMEGSDWREIIYVTMKNATDVCVGRINSDQDPFMSQIEIRTLEDSMYTMRTSGEMVDSNSRVLIYSRRIAFGSNQIIRYPNDSFDRIWSAETLGYRVVKSDITNFTTEMTSADDQKIPPLLLASGIIPNTTVSTANITIPMSYLPSSSVVIYNNMYFTEMSNVTGKNNTRLFNVGVDGETWWPGIEPPYKNVTRKQNTNTEFNNDSVFHLVPQINSTLPPIISGMEVFLIGPASDGTKEEDVKSLSTLQKQFPILQEWHGDPCLPINYSWEWVKCAYFTSPRVSILNLSSYGLDGPLPDFSNLSFLMIIDLSNNSLSGEIPDFLANFPELETLNLAGNNFTGKIPTPLFRNESIKQIYSGNPRLVLPDRDNGANITRPPHFILFLILYTCTTFLWFIV